MSGYSFLRREDAWYLFESIRTLYNIGTMSFEMFPDDLSSDDYSEIPRGPASDLMVDRIEWAAFMLRQPVAEVRHFQDQGRKAAYEEIGNNLQPNMKPIYIHGLFVGYVTAIETKAQEAPAVLSVEQAQKLEERARLRLTAARGMVQVVAQLTDRQLRKAEAKGLVNLKYYLQPTYDEDEEDV